MGNYRYIGASQSQIYGTQFVFKRYGQLVAMPDDVAASAMAQGLAILPDVEFTEIGHTEDELKAWGARAGAKAAPASFVAKRSNAWARLSARNVAASQAIDAAIAAFNQREKEHGQVVPETGLHVDGTPAVSSAPVTATPAENSQEAKS